MYTGNIVMRKRITMLLTIVTLALLALTLRLAYIQFVIGNDLQQRALDNRLREIEVEAKRGKIYDRNGKELAVSVSADSVGVYPVQIKEPEKVAKELSRILNLDEQEVFKKVSKRASFNWIKRKIEPGQAKAIKELNLKGVALFDEPRRYYPNGSLAAHLLGFVQLYGNVGGGGVEAALEQELSGIPGKIVVEYDAAGREIPQATHKYYPAQEGNSIVLTLDETIQHFVERELDKIVEKYQPKATSIILMEPKTGNILAMGSRPTYDPNNYGKFPQQVWRNYAVSDAYEPGSTFKVVTAAAGLEEAVVRPEDRFFDPGHYEVLGKKVKCWKAGGHGSQSFIEVVENSCNPGFIDVGLELGVDKFSNYVRAFGFGVPTGIQLPGEASGILVNPKRATKLDLATMSIGQSNAVTPIQLVRAVSAVANGGKLMKPNLVKEVRDVEGNLVKKVEPEVIRQVISEETAVELRSILESVVANGTGKNAYVEGYRGAGKTGTAQKASPGGGYAQGKYIASFVGFAPANDPKIAALIIIDEPQGPVYYGGQIAAPVFNAVVGDALKYLGVAPQVDMDSEAKEKFADNREEVVVPQVTNLELSEARQLLQGAKLTIEVEGDGPRVLSQFPISGAVVKEGTKVVLYVGTPNEGEHEGQPVTMPDLKGKTMREAASILAALGLPMEAQGSGVVFGQSVAPGSKVSRGTAIKVIFKSPSEQQPKNQTESQNQKDQDNGEGQEGP